MELREISAYLLYPELTDHEAVKLIDKMNKGFTTKREKIVEHTTQTKQVSAYALYYMATNIPKLPFVLSHLPNELINNLKKSHLFDLGSGPGTFSFSLLKEFGTDQKITAIDTSPLMLEQAKKILDGKVN